MVPRWGQLGEVGEAKGGAAKGGAGQVGREVAQPARAQALPLLVLHRHPPAPLALHRLPLLETARLVVRLQPLQEGPPQRRR